MHVNAVITLMRTPFWCASETAYKVMSHFKFKLELRADPYQM